MDNEAGSSCRRQPHSLSVSCEEHALVTTLHQGRWTAGSTGKQQALESGQWKGETSQRGGEYSLTEREANIGSQIWAHAVTSKWRQSGEHLERIEKMPRVSGREGVQLSPHDCLRL